MKRIALLAALFFSSTIALATDNQLSCVGNSCAVKVMPRTSGGSATTVIQANGDGSTAVGPSGSSVVQVVNGTVKGVTTITSNYTIGSGASGGGFFLYQISVTTNQTCTASCLATHPTASAPASGSCLQGWNSSTNPIGCASASANNFCLCAAIP